MAKPNSFFTDLATQYISQIDQILKQQEETNSLISGNPLSAEYRAEAFVVENLKTKIKLLFYEFDGGQIFKDRTDAVDNDRKALMHVQHLKSYSSLLSMFVDHIKTFRT